MELAKPRAACEQAWPTVLTSDRAGTLRGHRPYRFSMIFEGEANTVRQKMAMILSEGKDVHKLPSRLQKHSGLKRG